MPTIPKANDRLISQLTKPGLYRVASNLYVQVKPPPPEPPQPSDGVFRIRLDGSKLVGSKSYIFRFMHERVATSIGMGPTDLITLQAAKDKAEDYRRSLRAGINPRDAVVAQRKAKREEIAQTISKAKFTFEQACEAYIHANKQRWRSDRTRATWVSTLEFYAYPVIGKMDVAVVTKKEVAEILKPIWVSKSVTASHLRGRMETIFDYCLSHDHRTGDNPARLKGAIDNLMPAQPAGKKRHTNHVSLPYSEVPALWKRLETETGLAVPAFKFTILTAARSSEVRKAKWSEIDLEAKLFTLPPDRMKAGEKHIVPLSDAALDILREASKRKEGELVFNGRDAGLPMSDVTLNAIFAKLKITTVVDGVVETPVLHGMRSSFRTWAAEETRFPREIAEMSLAHSIGKAVEQSYSRGQLIRARRALMDDWADYVVGKGSAKAIRIARRKMDDDENEREAAD